MKKINKNSIVTTLFAVFFVFGLTGPMTVFAATSPSLGTAATYSILAGSSVTNTGATTISGDVGISPGIGSPPHFTGFGTVTLGGSIHDADAAALTAQGDQFAAFSTLGSQGCDTTYAGTKDLAGETLVPGVYCADSFLLTGTLTLNGIASDVWIFKSASDLVLTGGSVVKVLFTGGGQPCNVWWRAVSTATFDANSTLVGNILADTSITFAAGASLNGRALARTGAVTLSSNAITGPTCVVPPETVKVTIDKFLDGTMATAGNANNTSFSMTATWNAANIGSGTGSFNLGPVGFNSPNPYEAITSDMTVGASYSASENLPTTCDAGNPYALVGYTTGTTFAAASTATPTLTIPNFTTMQGDEFVIVWNKTCSEETLLKVHILKYLNGVKATAASANNFLFPMTATWQTTNLNGGAQTTGTYVLGNNHGGAVDLYGADTAPMQAPANYTTSEITDYRGQVLPPYAQCKKGKYKLQGYSTSAISFADAATKPISTAAPNFIGLNSDQYVIVWNTTCSPLQPPLECVITVKNNNKGIISNSTISRSSTGGNDANGSNGGTAGSGGNGENSGGNAGNGGAGGDGGLGGIIQTGNANSYANTINILNRNMTHLR